MLFVSVTIASATWPPGPTSYRRYSPGPFRPYVSGHGYRQKTGGSRCSATFPCSGFTLSFILDGPFRTIFPAEIGEDADFLRHYAAGGFNRQEVIELGRDAARFFKKQFGDLIDFTELSDDRYLLGGSDIAGIVSFRPYTLDPIGNYRLTSATRRDRVQFFNKRVGFAGWHLIFRTDFVSQGDFSGTVASSGISTVGSYVTRPCEGERYGTCKNILRPENPSKPIFIQVMTRDFVGEFGPGGFSIFNLDLQSADFGAGRGRGLRRQNDDGTADFVLTLIF